MTSVMICTPCYGNVVGRGYFNSTINSLTLLAKRKHRVMINTLGNESLITRARNNLLAQFLASDFEKLMFIDADISWQPEALLELLESDKLVCGIPYPTKSVDWDKVSKFVGKSAKKTPDEIRRSGLIYTINPTPGAVPANGWVEVQALGTGFLMIDRKVLEQMVDHYRDELSFTNDVAYYSTIRDEHCVGLFECLIDPETRRYLSEDYAFCRRWRDMGGSIHCNTNHRLLHSGTTDFG